MEGAQILGQQWATYLRKLDACQRYSTKHKLPTYPEGQKEKQKIFSNYFLALNFLAVLAMETELRISLANMNFTQEGKVDKVEEISPL